MKLEINIERNDSISDAIFNALEVFLIDNLDFHGEQSTEGAGEWIYQTAHQLMEDHTNVYGLSLDDLQEEIDEIQADFADIRQGE